MTVLTRGTPTWIDANVGIVAGHFALGIILGHSRYRSEQDKPTQKRQFTHFPPFKFWYYYVLHVCSETSCLGSRILIALFPLMQQRIGRCSLHPQASVGVNARQPIPNKSAEHDPPGRARSRRHRAYRTGNRWKCQSKRQRGRDRPKSSLRAG